MKTHAINRLYRHSFRRLYRHHYLHNKYRDVKLTVEWIPVPIIAITERTARKLSPETIRQMGRLLPEDMLLRKPKK